MSMPAPKQHIHVIGAGIVGACCAWWLQREGFAVTLIEKNVPGDGASLGNAGNIGLASVPPLSMPGIVKKVPKMLLDPMHPLTVRWRYLPKAIPWFIRFAMNSRHDSVQAIADARAALLSQAGEAFDTVLSDIGRAELITNTGLIQAFESETGIANSQYALDLRRDRGVRVEEMTGDQLRELEPALSDAIKGGIWYPDVRLCINPQRMTKVIAEAFVAAGGTLLTEEVKGFDIGPAGPRQIITDKGVHDCDRVVLAAGAWSRPLARELGYDLPLEAERGYHAMIAEPGVELKIPIAASERNVSLTPLEHGMRLTTTSEFSGIDAKPRHDRALRIIRGSQGILRDFKMDITSQWVGSRPSTPDSLPVIGRSPRFRNVIFAFGHGHLGVTFGAVTGRIVSQLAHDQTPNIDISAYRPDRDYLAGHLPPSPHA
jgi:D-amino-acid dehydrogenase